MGNSRNWTGLIDRNQTDQTDRNRTSRTDRNWTDQTDRTDRTDQNWTARPTGPNQMGGLDRSDIRQTKGSRIKDHGPCFGTNEHPGRDTDVILRQSKAPIEIFNFR